MPMNRQEIARARRRRSIESMLEVEQEREAILRERVEEMIGDADAWKLDADLVPALAPEHSALLEQMLLLEAEPDETSKDISENDIREMREDIEECQRRQRALQAYLDALDA